MGLILDLAVVALALVVIGSLALLAWTLAVSTVRAERRGLAWVADARRTTADAESRVRAAAARAGAGLEELDRHMDPHIEPSPSAGEQPDA